MKIASETNKALAINPHLQSQFTLHLKQKSHTPTILYYFKRQGGFLLLMAKAKYIFFYPNPDLKVGAKTGQTHYKFSHFDNQIVIFW